MVAPRIVKRRVLARLTLCNALLGAAYAAGCGDSDDGENGGKKTGGTSGTATGGKGGTPGDGGDGGSSAGKGGAGGSAGKGGTTATGGGTGKGGTTAAGGAPGGQGGEGDMGGETSGGAGGEGGVGPMEGPTCRAIHDAHPSAASGVFTIDPPGNTTGAPFPVYCDMTTSGGGWTLAFSKNSAHDGHYEDFCASYVRVAALAASPAVASSSATGAAGWLDLNTFPYAVLRLAGYRTGAQVYTSRAIQKSTLRLMFGQNGYFLYNDVNGYYWCGGDYAYTTDGVGQENKPSGAPDDCKGHTSLGDGWDFSTSNASNVGLTICGGGSVMMTTNPMSTNIVYPNPGGAQAIWVR